MTEQNPNRVIRKKKRKKRYISARFLWLILFLASIVFAITFWRMPMFPTKWKFIVVLVLAVIDWLTFLLTSKVRPSNIFAQVINTVLAVALIIVNIALPYYTDRFSNIFSSVLGNEVRIGIYVMTDAYKAKYKDTFANSEYKESMKLAEYQNATFITAVGVDGNNQNYALEQLSVDLKVSANEPKKKESTFSANVEDTQPQPEKKDKVAKGNIDYLYRIAYVKNTGENFELEKTELFDGNEITKLKESVNNLKQKLHERVNDNDDFYKEAISNCIEEIRYLFKSVDYKYENELRILRYANLDPSNDKIKIDKTSGIGRLYVERENSIQIGEVIFGPKFPNPEYVTPLLKLLDKEIKYKKSTIKFR